MSSKTLIAAAAGFVVLFLLAFLFYGWLLMDFFTANAGSVAGAMKESPDWPWVVIGEFLGALTLAVILGWAGVHTIGAGIQKGAVFGFLVALAVECLDPRLDPRGFPGHCHSLRRGGSGGGHAPREGLDRVTRATEMRRGACVKNWSPQIGNDEDARNTAWL